MTYPMKTPDGVEHYDNTVIKVDETDGHRILTDNLGKNDSTVGGVVNEDDGTSGESTGDGGSGSGVVGPPGPTGPSGPEGKRGHPMYIGTGAPTISASPGDTYLDQSNGTIYTF